MASSAKSLSFFFLLITLLFSMQIHARESQFFSKVTNAKETTTVPNKEETQTKEEPEPNFIPQTQNAYGLYGHESGQFPPTTTLTNTNGAPYTTTPTTNIPYNSEFEQPVNKNYRNTNYNPNVNPNNNYNYYNKESYGANNQNGMSNTRLTGTGGSYTTGTVNNNNNGGYRYNVDRQGMSDTRFMENGKYYYNPNTENNNNYNPNQYGNSRGVDSKNWNNGYYNTNNNNNNGNSYANNNDQFDENDEFGEP